MRMIIVDDDPSVIERFREEAEGIAELDIVGEFTDPRDALRFAGENGADAIEFALLDIVMPHMSGLELMHELKMIYPKLVVMFISSHDQYAAEAMRKKADYYIFKPFSHEEIEECVMRAGLLARRGDKRMLARTFGRFDLFVDGNLVKFRNAKAKELLALCVDHRGGEVTMEEAIDKLWEDREYDSKVKQCYRTAVMQLRATLIRYRALDLFKTKRGSCFIDTNLLDCDLYDLLDGKEEAVCKFDEYYMMEYSWAEETVGSLCQLLDKMADHNTIGEI